MRKKDRYKWTKKKLREMVTELAKGIKTQDVLGKLTGFMNKLVFETALNEEMAQHLGHEKHQKKNEVAILITVIVKRLL